MKGAYLGPAKICSKLRFGGREHGARQLNWRELVLARLASPLISSSELLIGPCATEFAIGIDNVFHRFPFKLRLSLVTLKPNGLLNVASHSRLFDRFEEPNTFLEAGRLWIR